MIRTSYEPEADATFVWLGSEGLKSVEAQEVAPGIMLDLDSEERGVGIEVLDLSERIRQMILDKRPASEIKRAARDEGMTFLRESAIEKVKSGITTLKEINKVTFIE